MAGSTRPAGPASVTVDVDDRQQALVVDTGGLAGLLEATLVDQRGTADAEVGLAFVDIAEMTELNAAHMGGSGPTDVLAFPIDGLHEADVPAGQPALLGDIVICPEVAARAPQSTEDELALLVVHGALHLLGHDHVEPDETATMKALETDILERFHHR